MTNCADCRELERQLEEASVGYLLVASTHGPEDEPTKAAKRMAQIQERFNDHKASHGMTFGSSAL